MITLQDLSHYLEALFSPEKFQDYAPNGMQVEGKQGIRQVAFAVSASVAAIEKAAQCGADALIVHHGIFWSKQSPLVTGSRKKKLELLLREGISLFAYHLPLDAHVAVGNNWVAAKELGLQEVVPFLRVGVKGSFPKVSIEAFQARVETYYGHSAHAALGGKREVESAAIVSGGAHRLIEEAASSGVDCFVTGSFDEPVWDIAFERGIHFLALGHYATGRKSGDHGVDAADGEGTAFTLHVD